VGDQGPGGRAFDRALEVLGETTATAEPGEGALDHPAPRQDDEALGGRGALDDLERPSAEPGQRRRQLVAGVATVGEQMAQPGEAVADRLRGGSVCLNTVWSVSEWLCRPFQAAAGIGVARLM
jgi:hypothetical protein